MAELKFYAADAPRYLSDILIFEIDPRYSRESGELAPLDTALPLGAVLCLAEDGTYIPFGAEISPPKPAEEEGGEAAPAVTANKPCAVLISRDIEPSEDTQPCVVIRRGACVSKTGLSFPDSVTENQKKTALAELAALGILPKE